MWSLIPSFEILLQSISGVFTEPSLRTHCEVLVGWFMCVGRRTEYRVFETIQADEPVDRNTRHPFDRFYNFFNRSSWKPSNLAAQVLRLIVTQLDLRGDLELIVDDTLIHKSGDSVFGIGWFHDAVASNEKRDVTALGNSWVVVSLVVRVPFVDRIFCLPINARLRLAGKEHPGPAKLALEMLEEIVAQYPNRDFKLIADGGYSSGKLIKSLSDRVQYYGLMRNDAALNDVAKPTRRSKSGPVPKYGPRIKSPKKRLALAARKNAAKKNRWKQITVNLFGEKRRFKVLVFQALWTKVAGERPLQVVVCRPLDKGYDVKTLFTTDLTVTAEQIIEQYARRTSIEACFKDSKQVMQIDKPQHWSKTSIKKLAPWVWLMQSFLTVWYLTEGRETEEAEEARQNMNDEWDTEWSVRHMVRLFRRIVIREKINSMSACKDDMRELTSQLESYLYLAS